jgi:hypothetical protein
MKYKATILEFAGLTDGRINTPLPYSLILKSSHPINPNSDNGELPKGWKWVNLKDICNIIGGITS